LFATLSYVLTLLFLYNRGLIKRLGNLVYVALIT